jgi:hypothetical protein
VLPTIAYVGGPTELRYLEQTSELYAWAGVPRPRTVPRVSLHLARTRDVATLTELGGLEALRATPRPLEQIGRAALVPRAHALLLEVEALLERVASSRLGARAPLDVGELQARLMRLERRMPGALPSLPHTARHWPHARVTLRERAAALRGRSPGASARAVTRLRHDLYKLRRSLLRDGRCTHPEALAAWRRTSPSPVPPERRMTVAELLTATTPALPRAVLATLEAELSPALAIGIGGHT